MSTKGWTEIMKPLLDKMIADVVGSRHHNGVWDSGSFGDKRLGDVRADKLLWYRQFGIDFNNHLYSFYNVAKGAAKRLKEKDNDDYNIPLIDSKYSIDTPGLGAFEESYTGEE